MITEESEQVCPRCGATIKTGIINGKKVTYCCTAGCFSVGTGWNIIPTKDVVEFLQQNCALYSKVIEPYLKGEQDASPIHS
jgi:hypothetical protein